MSINIDITCRCGASLTFNVDQKRNDELEITVEPCDVCLSNVETEAYGRGQEEERERHT